ARCSRGRIADDPNRAAWRFTRLRRTSAGCACLRLDRFHERKWRRSIFRRLLQTRSEEHTSELQSRGHLVCRLLLEKKKKIYTRSSQHNNYHQHATILIP